MRITKSGLKKGLKLPFLCEVFWEEHIHIRSGPILSYDLLFDPKQVTGPLNHPFPHHYNWNTTIYYIGLYFGIKSKVMYVRNSKDW